MHRGQLTPPKYLSAAHSCAFQFLERLAEVPHLSRTMVPSVVGVLLFQRALTC